MNEVSEKTVYFVRHGKSEGSGLRHFKLPNSCLLEEGIQQSKLIAGRIAKINFDLLLSSPIHRVRETAEIISEVANKKVEYSDLFKERIKPSWLFESPSLTSPKTSIDQEINQELIERWEKWDKDSHVPGYKSEDGESYDDFIKRVDEALDFLKDKKEKIIVVVTHGFFLQALLARILIGDFLTSEIFRNFKNKIKIENTSISAIKYVRTKEGMIWRLFVYNDHAHLG
ncbi:MAG: histidine phosphatase family protein [Patescibacteria group bacterium]